MLCLLCPRPFSQLCSISRGQTSSKIIHDQLIYVYIYIYVYGTIYFNICFKCMLFKYIHTPRTIYTYIHMKSIYHDQPNTHYINFSFQDWPWNQTTSYLQTAWALGLLTCSLWRPCGSLAIHMTGASERSILCFKPQVLRVHDLRRCCETRDGGGSWLRSTHKDRWVDGCSNI